MSGRLPVLILFPASVTTSVFFMFPHPIPPSNERFHEGKISGLLPLGAPGSPPVLSAEISRPGPKLEAEVLGAGSGEENTSFWGILESS